jgi:hypothetical protein
VDHDPKCHQDPGCPTGRSIPAATIQGPEWKELSYQQYCALLESAAVAFDGTHKDKPRTNRKVYSHDLQFDIDYQASPDGDSPTTYNVHRASMTRDRWNKLDNTAHTIWDLLPDEAKAVILDLKPPHNCTPHRPRYAANLHEMSAHDLLSSLSMGSTTDGKDTDTTSTDTHNKDDKDSTASNPILTMLTQQRTSFTANQQDKKHPGDITRMMSKSNAKKPPSSVIIDGVGRNPDI